MFDLNALGRNPRMKLMNFTPEVKENLMFNKKRVEPLKSSAFLDFQSIQSPLKFEKSIDEILKEIKNFRRSLSFSQGTLKDFLLEHSERLLRVKQDSAACNKLIGILKEKAVCHQDVGLQLLLKLSESYLKAVRKIRMSTLKSKVKFISSASSSKLLFKSDGLLNVNHENLDRISDPVQAKPLPADAGDRKQQFFSLCLATKLTMHFDHPFQKLSIPGLFSEAADLSPRKWQDYINRKINDS